MERKSVFHIIIKIDSNDRNNRRIVSMMSNFQNSRNKELFEHQIIEDEFKYAAKSSANKSLRPMT